MIVVLPAPFGPSSVTTSPRFTAKLTPWSTSFVPYRILRSSTATAGCGLTVAVIGYDRVPRFSAGTIPASTPELEEPLHGTLADHPADRRRGDRRLPDLHVQRA